jgi:putative SOS response-associated peptidase YedK
MCGRYVIGTSPRAIALAFDVQYQIAFEPHYNAAPTQILPIIRMREGTRQLELRRWGLVPWWAKDTKIGSSLINARGGCNSGHTLKGSEKPDAR